MILACPTCSARFLVDSAAIGPDGREVRCGRCNHSWFARLSDDQAEPVAPTPSIEAAPEADEAPLIADPEPEPEIDDGPPPLNEPLMHAARDPDAPGPPPRRAGGGRNLPAVRSERRRWPARLAWIALVVVLIGLGAAASFYRDKVIAMWPAAEALYAAAGVEPQPLGFGLNLIIVSSNQEERDGQPILKISGRIENTTKSSLAVPDLRAALYDEKERELQGWTFAAPVATLPPNQNASFETEVPNPAKNAVRLSIVFHEDKDDGGH